MKAITKKKKIIILNAMIIALVVLKDLQEINNIVLNVDQMCLITLEKIQMMNTLIALVKNAKV